MGFIGTNRTGKSSEAKNLAKKWRLNHPTGFILSFDPQDNFSEFSDEYLYVKDKDNNEMKISSLEVYKNEGSLLILDDYRLLQRRPIEEEWLVTIMNFRAKWNVDIIYITHNPRLVLNYLTYFTSHYFIFYTKSKEGSFEDKIPDYELCDQASRLTNAYVKINGRGEYPNFPHIIVDTEEEELKLKNMDREKFKLAENKVKQENKQ